MRIDLFDARVLQPLVTYLHLNGAAAEAFLDRVRIPIELTASGGWVTKKQAYDFTLDVVQRTGCSHTVFAAYLGFEFDHLGPIADAMRACATVKEALDVGVRLGSRAYEGNHYFLTIDGDTTWFCYRENDVVSDGQTFINDMTLTVYYQLIRILADPEWRPTQILLRDGAFDRRRPVENFEQCRVNWHADFSALGFPTAFLSRRLPWERPAEAFNPDTAWLAGPAGSEPIANAVYRLVASRFPYDKAPTIDHIAHMASTSPATIKRRLAAAGTSYREVLDRLRFDLACDMLSCSDAPIKEIAQELRYSSTANFVRSFRRMTGTSPRRYRLERGVADGGR